MCNCRLSICPGCQGPRAAAEALANGAAKRIGEALDMLDAAAKAIQGQGILDIHDIAALERYAETADDLRRLFPRD